MRAGLASREDADDLVVVDLDDPDEAARLGPTAHRRYFEDHYAELPFGLGTVPRRLDHSPWWARPGALAWIALALVGLLALAGGGTAEPDEGREPSRVAPRIAPPPPQRRLPPLREPTGARLVLWHNDEPSILDVDSGRVGGPRPGEHATLPVPPRTDLGVRIPPPYAATTAGRVAAAEWVRPGRWRLDVTDRGAHVADVGLGAAQVLLAWSRDGRWAFAAAGVDLVVVDATTGSAARVEVTLPPFEALFAV